MRASYCDSFGRRRRPLYIVNIIMSTEEAPTMRGALEKDGQSTATSENGSSSSEDAEKREDDTESVKSGVNLKRQVGLMGGVALIAGSMIGSGIFVSPGKVLRSSQSPGLCLIIWTICGIYSLLGALSYCELGTLIPKSGGEFSYFLECFGRGKHRFWGRIPSYLFAWVSMFVLKPSSLAIGALSFAKYLATPILQLINFCSDEEYQVYVVTRLLAAVCIGAVSFLNCYSVKAATKVQIIFTVAKLTAIAIIIFGGFYYLAIGYTDNFDNAFEGSINTVGGIAASFYGGLYAYEGWNKLNFITEELQDPYKNLPRAIIIAVPLVTVCYVLVNLGYLAVLTEGEILNSQAVAVDWARIVLGPATFLIILGVLFSVVGSLNGNLFAAARIAHVAGREGQMMTVLSFIQVERRTPIAPILLDAAVAILMTIPGDIASLIDFFGFTSSIFYCLAMIALIVMRFTKKDAHRPIKVPIIIPIIVMCISAYLVIAPIASDPQIEYLYAFLFIIGGLVFYVPFVHFGKVLPGTEGFTALFQKIFMMAHPQ